MGRCTKRLNVASNRSPFGQLWVGYLAAAPNGNIVANPVACWSNGFIRMKPDGSILWGVRPDVTMPPRAPDFVGADYGGGTHDNYSLACDVTNSVYRAAGNLLVKLDAHGQLLLAQKQFPTANACSWPTR